MPRSRGESPDPVVVPDREHSVRQAVLRDIDALPVELRESTTAKIAIALAEQIDRDLFTGETVSPPSKALVDVLATLRALAAPLEQSKDPTDRVRAQREKRRSAG